MRAMLNTGFHDPSDGAATIPFYVCRKADFKSKTTCGLDNFADPKKVVVKVQCRWRHKDGVLKRGLRTLWSEEWPGFHKEEVRRTRAQMVTALMTEGRLGLATKPLPVTAQDVSVPTVRGRQRARTLCTPAAMSAWHSLDDGIVSKVTGLAGLRPAGRLSVTCKGLHATVSPLLPSLCDLEDLYLVLPIVDGTSEAWDIKGMWWGLSVTWGLPTSFSDLGPATSRSSRAPSLAKERTIWRAARWIGVVSELSSYLSAATGIARLKRTLWRNGTVKPYRGVTARQRSLWRNGTVKPYRGFAGRQT